VLIWGKMCLMFARSQRRSGSVEVRWAWGRRRRRKEEGLSRCATKPCLCSLFHSSTRTFELMSHKARADILTRKVARIDGLYWHVVFGREAYASYVSMAVYQQAHHPEYARSSDSPRSARAHSLTLLYCKSRTSDFKPSSHSAHDSTRPLHAELAAAQQQVSPDPTEVHTSGTPGRFILVSSQADSGPHSVTGIESTPAPGCDIRRSCA